MRFFAFFDDYKDYPGRLSKFLNDYMKKNKNINEYSKIEKYTLFKRTVDLIHKHFSDKKSLSDIGSKVIMEGLLIGVAKNLDYLEAISQEDFQRKFIQLRQSTHYSVQNLAVGLLQKGKVESRLDKAIDIFGDNQVSL